MVPVKAPTPEAPSSRPYSRSLPPRILSAKIGISVDSEIAIRLVSATNSRMTRIGGKPNE